MLVGNCSKTRNCINLVKNSANNMLRSVCTTSRRCCAQAASVKTSHTSSSTKVTVPLRKKRDELSVLQALASTVRTDYNSPKYKLMDDPFLIPSSHREKRNVALAKASGRKSAQFVIATYPKCFSNDLAEPRIEALMPPMEPQFADDTVEGLQERIALEKPLAAYECYQKLQQAGTEIPANDVEDLLDLLCFYNSDNPLEPLQPDELYYQYETGMAVVQKRWRDDGAAELIFKQLQEQSVRSCCSIIRGRAKYGQAERAYELYQELRYRDTKLTVQTYNAVIGAVATFKQHAEPRWELIQDILRDMATSGVQPDVNTFNAVLSFFSRSGKLAAVSRWSILTLNEMKECGIEPTLSSWHFALRAAYAHEDSQSRLLYSIIDYLKGREFTVHGPTDYEFFAKAMSICFRNLKDLELAYKIDALVDVANNRRLLGNAHQDNVYYTHFLRLLCMFEQIDTIMYHYDRLVPHVYMPTFALMLDLLTAVELNDGYKYLPRFWSDFVLFNFTRREDLVENLLAVMAKRKQDPTLQELFVKVVSNVLIQCETDAANPRITNPFTLTGPMIGDMMLIHLNAGSSDQAWDILQLYVQKRLHVSGFPSESSLTKMAEVCVNDKDVDKCLQTLSLMSDFGYANLDKLVEKVKDAMELTDHQRSHFDDLL